MKLISMTDFVLEKSKISQEKAISEIMENFSLINNYASFLKQHLTLGMFVPCDENGNVLEHFPIHRFADDPEKYSKYKKAKEKVLFKDFRFVKSDVETLNHTTFIQNYKGEQVGYNKSWEESWNLYGTIIEDLIGFEIEFTESAIKQIGL